MAPIVDPTNYPALLDLLIKQVQNLGSIVQAQQRQITDLHLELRNRLDRLIRVILVTTVLLVAALFAIVHLAFVAYR